MVAAYSYMALVPIIQPPVIRLLTTKKERLIRMPYEQKSVGKTTRILFPILTTIVAGVVAPASVSLVGFLMFGNLIRECGVLNSLSETAQKVLANLVTHLPGADDRVADAGGKVPAAADAADSGTGAFCIRVRHGRRCSVREIFEPVPQKEDQPHDRRGGHFGVPDVRRGLSTRWGSRKTRRTSCSCTRSASTSPGRLRLSSQAA